MIEVDYVDEDVLDHDDNVAVYIHSIMMMMMIMQFPGKCAVHGWESLARYADK